MVKNLESMFESIKQFNQVNEIGVLSLAWKIKKAVETKVSKHGDSLH